MDNLCIQRFEQNFAFYVRLFLKPFPVGNENLTCSSISYFPPEKYQPDDQDSTHAIPCKKMKMIIFYDLE